MQTTSVLSHDQGRSHFPKENMESNIGSHYTNISKKYDHMYEPFHQAYIPMIINKLQLKPDDLLLDIGAATGQLAHLLWKHVGLKNAVTCVEPCEAFFEHASKLDGILPVVETAEQFCDNLPQMNNQKPFNKVLICSVAHHIQDVTNHIGQIIDSLPKNGVFFTLNQPRNAVSLPFTAGFLRQLKEMPDVLDVILSYVKSRDDVITEVSNEQPTFKIPKSRWYSMIRNRFWSTFDKYTDEEIEEFIKELDNERFQGVEDEELITVVDTMIGVKLTKQ